MNYNKTLWEEFINDSRNFHLDSFSMKDHLQPDFWENDTIKYFISNRLIEIVNDFMEFCGLDEGYYEDITLTGSLANYNWSEFSDVDLHIIVDFKTIDENTELVREFFNSKRSLWNRTHDIRVFGFEVELYVQDAHESHVSTGVFSILNDEWIVEPMRSDPQIDYKDIKKKADSLEDQIDRVVKVYEEGNYEEAIEKADKLKEKIRRLRKAGLDDIGEYSVENLAFKTLRRNGYLWILSDVKNNSYDKMMSIE